MNPPIEVLPFSFQHEKQIANYEPDNLDFFEHIASFLSLNIDSLKERVIEFLDKVQ